MIAHPANLCCLQVTWKWMIAIAVGLGCSTPALAQSTVPWALRPTRVEVWVVTDDSAVWRHADTAHRVVDTLRRELPLLAGPRWDVTIAQPEARERRDWLRSRWTEGAPSFPERADETMDRGVLVLLGAGEEGTYAVLTHHGYRLPHTWESIRAPLAGPSDALRRAASLVVSTYPHVGRVEEIQNATVTVAPPGILLPWGDPARDPFGTERLLMEVSAADSELRHRRFLTIAESRGPRVVCRGADSATGVISPGAEWVATVPVPFERTRIRLVDEQSRPLPGLLLRDPARADVSLTAFDQGWSVVAGPGIGRPLASTWTLDGEPFWWHTWVPGSRWELELTVPALEERLEAWDALIRYRDAVLEFLAVTRAVPESPRLRELRAALEERAAAPAQLGEPRTDTWLRERWAYWTEQWREAE